MNDLLALTAPDATDDGRAFRLLAQERAGVSPVDITAVAAHYALSQKELAHLLRVDIRTVQRAKGAQTAWKPQVSTNLLDALQILRFGEEVFGDRPKLLRWLRRPHGSLDGNVPLDLLAYSAGRRLVHDALGRIAHGVFA